MKKLLANNIKKYYGKDDCIVKAVDDISLEIERGKFTSIVRTLGKSYQHYFTVWLALINQHLEMCI